MTHPFSHYRAANLAPDASNEDQDKLDLARTEGPMAFMHGTNGLRPVGNDGWPLTDEEILMLDVEVTDTLSLLSGGQVLDVEPESGVDLPTDTRRPKEIPMCTTTKPQQARRRLPGPDIDARRSGAVADEELNPGFFSEEAQQIPAWLEWAQPERISAQVERLLTETLPDLPGLSAVPDADPYSDEMLDWVGDAFNLLFPEPDALFERDNTDLADQFVCYVGETLRNRAGGVWFNEDYGDNGSVFYDLKITPAIGYRYDTPSDEITGLLFEAAEADGGPDFNGVIGPEIYSRTVDYADAHGLPHEFHEVRKRHGLT